MFAAAPRQTACVSPSVPALCAGAGLIPVGELCLAAKPVPFTGVGVQCCPRCRCHLDKAAPPPLSPGLSSGASPPSARCQRHVGNWV